MCSGGRMAQTIFRVIDQILANAALSGLKVIVVPINNWQEVDGVPTYLQVPIRRSHDSALISNRPALGLVWLGGIDSKTLTIQHFTCALLNSPKVSNN